MNNPFKKDEFIEARLNARMSADRVQKMMEAKNPVYTAKFIHAGVCGYREQNDITYLSSETLQKMASTFIGRPVILSPHDLNITPENIAEKAKGTVTDCWTDDGENWWVKFVVEDEKVNRKIQEQGYNFVSCAYLITESGEPEVHDGIECSTVVLNGFYHHLAITNSPRYDDSQVWRVNENKCLKNVMISDIVDINETKGKKMFGFRKVETSIDEDLLFDTACGRLNTADMVEKINELSAEVEQLKQKEVPAEPVEPEVKAEEDKIEEAEKPADEVVEPVEAEEKAEEADIKENNDTEGAAKENEDVQDSSSVLKDAIVKANEEAAASDVVANAIPKENEDDSKVATCSVRGLSTLK